MLERQIEAMREEVVVMEELGEGHVRRRGFFVPWIGSVDSQSDGEGSEDVKKGEENEKVKKGEGNEKVKKGEGNEMKKGNMSECEKRTKNTTSNHSVRKE